MTALAGIELRHLRYFLAVFEELHFGRAAERLHMSQPPLSQAIRKLEKELGVSLFLRSSRTVAATAEGRIFAEAARKVLASLEAAVAETRRAGGVSSVLRVGASPYIPIEPVHRFLALLHERDPPLRTQMSHVVAVEQMQLLRAGELDLGIFPAPYLDPALEAHPLSPGEPLGVLLPVGHRLAAKKVVVPEDLTKEDFLIIPRAPDPAFHDALRLHIESAGYRFRDFVETRSMTAREVLFGVADGLGVSLVPHLAELNEVEKIVVRRALDPPVAMPDTVVAWRKHTPSPERSTLAAVRETARDVYEQPSPSARARRTVGGDGTRGSR